MSKASGRRGIADYLGNLTPGETTVASVWQMTPTLARTLRDSYHFERQRPLSKDNINRLGFELRNGWFVPGTPIYLCVLPDRSAVIVNGNHTLEAVFESGVTTPLTVIEHAVSGIDEAGHIYAKLDLQKVRSWGVALNATGIEVALADKVMAGLGTILSGFGTRYDVPRAQSREVRFQMVETYKAAASVIAASLRNAPLRCQQKIKRAPVLAVALETARHQPSAAEEFWSAVAHDDGLRAGDPAKTLLHFLDHSLLGAAGRPRVVRMATGAALAWNAFFEGRQLHDLRPGSVRAFKILGTPWQVGKDAGMATMILPPGRLTEPSALPAEG